MFIPPFETALCPSVWVQSPPIQQAQNQQSISSTGNWKSAFGEAAFGDLFLFLEHCTVPGLGKKSWNWA